MDWLSLLLRLVGSEDFPNLLVVGCTNRKHAIDPAFLRPGRVEDHFFCGRLGAAARFRLLSNLATRKQLTLPPQSTDFRQVTHSHMRGLLSATHPLTRSFCVCADDRRPDH